MIVDHVSLRDFRSYASLELELDSGLVLVTGANGVGKTNLLEALHVGSQGFSPRTRADAQLVRLGSPASRVRLAGTQAGTPVATEVALARGEPKRARLNGAPLPAIDELRARVSALAFVPDRLAVVKGGPAVRRIYVDRALGRLFPARAELPSEYARTLAQRNEALRRVRVGASTLEAVAPWTDRTARLAAALDTAREELVELLAPRFAERAAALCLRGAGLRYDADPPVTREALDARLARDVERGATGLGPHLRDIAISAEDRDLRSFGSQGEQRTAVLALALAEADAILERRGSPPLLLLDDVLSELDESRRRALLTGLPEGGQTIVTATSRDALPARGPDPALLVRVQPGEARRG